MVVNTVYLIPQITVTVNIVIVIIIKGRKYKLPMASLTVVMMGSKCGSATRYDDAY